MIKLSSQNQSNNRPSGASQTGKRHLERFFLAALAFAIMPLFAAGDLRLGSHAGVAGTSLIIPADYANGSGAVGLRFDVFYDPTVLNPVTANIGSDLIQHGVFAAEIAPGVLRVVINPKHNPLEPLPQGNIANLAFQIVPDSVPGSYPLGLGNVQLAEENAQEVASGVLTPGEISVRKGNAPPLAAGGHIPTLEDAPVSGSLNASDADGDTLLFQVVQQASKGQVFVTNPATGAFTFIPAPNAEGPDSFNFSASDPAGLSSDALVTLQIQPVNDAPTATAAVAQTREDESAAILPSVTDVDVGESFNFAVLLPPTHGQISTPGGQLTYEPDPDYHGPDQFEYRATDSGGLEIDGTAYIAVLPVNDAPTSTSAAFDLMEDASQSVVPTVEDIDDSSHRFLIVVPPSHGTASVEGDRVVYRPDPDFNGQDQFVFRAIDSGFLDVDSSANITVHPINDAPTDTSALLIACLDLESDGVTPYVMDADLDFEGDSFNFSLLTQPSNGTATLVDNQLVYIPKPDHLGPDSFTFRATDLAGASIEGVASVDVIPFEGLMVLGERARGLGAVHLNATTDCGEDPFLFEWYLAANGQLLDVGTTFVVDPLPDLTTDYEIRVVHPNNGEELRSPFRILVHPAGLDLNGDGLNDLADLNRVLPDWLGTATMYEADGDDVLTILDLLYINLQDANFEAE